MVLDNNTRILLHLLLKIANAFILNDISNQILKIAAETYGIMLKRKQSSKRGENLSNKLWNQNYILKPALFLFVFHAKDLIHFGHFVFMYLFLISTKLLSTQILFECTLRCIIYCKIAVH